jgi:hypothetical protein
MFLITGVDAFRGIPDLKVSSHFKPGEFLEDRHAVFFCSAGVNRGFKHHIIAFFEYPAYRFACPDEGREVGKVVMVDGRRDGYDMKTACPEVFRIGCEGDVAVLECLCGKLFTWIDAFAHHLHAVLPDVKPDNRYLFRKLERDGKSHVAEADER